jgi:hypothetical protein
MLKMFKRQDICSHGLEPCKSTCPRSVEEKLLKTVDFAAENSQADQFRVKEGKISVSRAFRHARWDDEMMEVSKSVL